MKAQRMLALAVLLLVSGCGDRVPRDQAGGGSTTPPIDRGADDPTVLGNVVQPVRVGELGPSFAACAARGETRARAVPVPVRAGPFEAGETIDRLGEGAEFFICSRTLDQRWFGIVYDEGGRASTRCGVDRPSTQRRPYQGPCVAGWVPSEMTALVSGEPHQMQAPANEAAPVE
jgi:hypothetical protein